jgi:ADP-ribose pyrophosphatase YjhB (NUDIX family)
MTEAETEQLRSLLLKLRAEGLAVPRMPCDVWKALRGLVVQTAVEILITRNGDEFLLTWREDQHWRGWHIPGGFLGPEESLKAACRRIAKRELGIEVIFEHLLMAYVWPDHPYASVVSLLCICSTESTPCTGSFHQRIPEDTLPNHDALLRAFLDKLNIGNQIVIHSS